MKQHSFEQQHSALWSRIESYEKLKNNAPELNQLPEEYQTASQHLALAKQRRYSSALIHRLNRIVTAGHNRIYRDLPRTKANFLYYMVAGFPISVRRNRRFVYCSTALFLLPGLIFFALCLFTDSMIYSLMSYEDVKNFEMMYEPGKDTFGRDRESDTDFAMFGFYIRNNIGISFQVFASGILFGIGSVFFLMFNGIHIGAAAGHISQVGYTDTFFPFVVGHGSFELTAIVLAGAAGLKIGWAMLAPGNLRRSDALKIAAKEAIVIIYGSTIMLFIAAFIEAFWSSSSTLAIPVKYSVGALLWFLVFYYFIVAGREHAAR